MVKLVYTRDLKSLVARHAGSIPALGTNIMPFESEQEQKRRRSLEGREAGLEEKENKENDAELKKAAGLERADVIVKEIKQSQKQMQSIIVHMQTVLAAIRRLRRQLQLAESSVDPSSIKQDKKQVEELKKKIKEYGDELEKMRGDLIREQMEELSRGVEVGMTAEGLREKAEEMVDKMIAMVRN